MFYRMSFGGGILKELEKLPMEKEAEVIEYIYGLMDIEEAEYIEDIELSDIVLQNLVDVMGVVEIKGETVVIGKIERYIEEIEVGMLCEVNRISRGGVVKKSKEAEVTEKLRLKGQ